MSLSSPLPAYSSPAPASSRAANGRRRASFSGQLAFLVHSQETVANCMPPDVDNKALARQKRRRTRYVSIFCFVFCLLISTMLAMFNALERALAPTGVCSAYPATSDAPSHIALTLTTTSCSKEDEDVLKAEYLKNPKPDKALRLEIVSKVALGEKEVQVRPPILIHVTSVRLLLTCTRPTDLVPK
jgi:hypothetical protein